MLLDQAAIIGRLSVSSVDEESDRADIDRAYQSVLRVHAALPETQAAPRGGGPGARQLRPRDTGTGRGGRAPGPD